MGDNVIQIRRDTRANWLLADPVLNDGEFGHVTGELDLRIGDGIRPFSSLENILAQPATLASANW